MKITKNNFANEEVILDFHEYESCQFTNCRFVVLGYGPFALNQCEVVNCEFTFAGPAAMTRQSVWSATTHPPAIACPLIAAIVGYGAQKRRFIVRSTIRVRTAPGRMVG